MPDNIRTFPQTQSSPTIAPHDMSLVLQDADALLALMGREPLCVVAELADTLIHSAHEAGASEIESAANDLRNLISGRGPVALTGAMYALTEAITRTESCLAA